jgi:hypothetical protein
MQNHVARQTTLVKTTPAVGRPKAITPKVVQELATCLRQGNDIKTACIFSGICTSTYYNELARNKRFMDKMTIAQNETTIYANLVVKEAIEKRQDVKTARWWIDRQDKLERQALRAKEYRLIKKITLAEEERHTKSIEIELG